MQAIPKRRKTINIQASQSLRERLERLKQRLGTRSTSEVVRRALECYEPLLEADYVEISSDGLRYKIQP